ncbi:hypothetical protein [Fluviicola taffensis]|uniref:DUF2231 domain-containing protein n=1 Tax=Fluviicola taffensis (strain DSM 16823 / NCIMB 13979 / RW262) TaxID=755732 RepID=F2II72_FLUTR|nr:hypothetical protein [Fluviicola taffensis]AEA43781.1 hypothetical protein Fluta_1791 [Fluviicola taffensis DSM 16823]
MNDAHFHLVVNHLPLIFPLVGAIVLVTGILSRSEPIKRTGYFVFILGSIATILAMSSGEGAEEVVEEIKGVSQNFIHEHEEKAELFALLSYGLGLISLLSLWFSWKQKRLSKPASLIVLAFSFVVLFFGKQTGTSGGEIRHTEIRENEVISRNSNEHNE